MALRYCGQAGCGVLVERGRCAAHTKTQRVVNDRFQVGETRYDTARWRDTARRFRAAHPLCANSDCGVAGCTLVTEVVDHRVPHRGDARLFWDQTNWQPLCKACHAAKTARETAGAPAAGLGGGRC